MSLTQSPERCSLIFWCLCPKVLLHHSVASKAQLGRMTGLIGFICIQSKHLKNHTVVISTSLRGALFISSLSPVSTNSAQLTQYILVLQTVIVFSIATRVSVVYLHTPNCLVGLVVKVSAPSAEDPGFESCLRQIFFGSSHTSDFKMGTPVATLPGTWHYRVSTGTGRPVINILWLGEVESLICNFYLSVAACKIVCADPSLRYTSMLLGR